MSPGWAALEAAAGAAKPEVVPRSLDHSRRSKLVDRPATAERPRYEEWFERISLAAGAIALVAPFVMYSVPSAVLVGSALPPALWCALFSADVRVLTRSRALLVPVCWFLCIMAVVPIHALPESRTLWLLAVLGVALGAWNVTLIVDHTDGRLLAPISALVRSVKEIPRFIASAFFALSGIAVLAFAIDGVLVMRPIVLVAAVAALGVLLNTLTASWWLAIARGCDVRSLSAFNLSAFADSYGRSWQLLGGQSLLVGAFYVPYLFVPIDPTVTSLSGRPLDAALLRSLMWWAGSFPWSTEWPIVSVHLPASFDSTWIGGTGAERGVYALALWLIALSIKLRLDVVVRVKLDMLRKR